MSAQQETNAAALLNACGFCGQHEGEWCVAKSGGRASWLHSARLRPVNEGWFLGYQAGQQDGRSTLRRIAKAGRAAEASRPRVNVDWMRGFYDLLNLIEREADR